MTSTPATGDTYGLGEPIAITVTFDKPVTVVGRPGIVFRIDAGPRLAVYSSGSGGTDLVFTYTVLDDDMDDDGILLAGGEVELVGDSTIRAVADNTVDATRTYAEPGLQSGHKVDGLLITTTDAAATLSALALSGVTLAPTFVSATQDYTATVVNAVTETTVTATPTHSGATVAFKDGADNALTNPVALAVGANVIKAVVTAEDTTTMKTYMVTVTREPSDTTSPSPAIAAVESSGIEVAVVFDEVLASPVSAVVGAFTLTADGVVLDIDSLSWNAATLIFDVASGTKIYPGQTVRLSYDKTAAGADALEDAAGNEVASFTDFPVTNNSTVVNNPPVFSSFSASFAVDEHTAAGQNVGDALTATDADNDPLTFTLEGTDAASFDLFTTSGSAQIQTLAALDYETKSSYSVIVKVDDGNGGTDTASMTINVTDENEPPARPAAPSVSSVADSTTSLLVIWTAPENTGRPAIDHYDLRYRQGTSGDWTDGPQNVPGPSATIMSLTANTLYQVQVLATNDDGDSPWSLPGSGGTNTAGNTAPTFSVSTFPRSVAENSPAGTDVGNPVTATDADNDPLRYTLEGTDAASFTIVSTSGQIRTRSGVTYDREAKDSYAVIVKADDGAGGTDTVFVTIVVTDVNEPPLAPAAPTVRATPNTTDSLSVTWSAPSSTGRPAIVNYDLQYREGTTGTWTDGPQNVSGTSATIAGLTADPAAYQVQVRATNNEGDGDWSPPGRIRGGGRNDPPLAVDDAAETVEDTPVTIDVLANDSDPNGDTLTVVEVSAPSHGTAVVADTGAVVYTPEPDYHGTDRFTYVVGDGSGLTAQAAVEVTVLPVNDPPLAGDDAADTPEDTPVTIDVLANDSDPNGDTLTVVEVSAPSHGTAVVAAAGTVEYTPEPDYHGTDRFTYVVGDGSGLTAQAAVEVTVLPVNDPPEAVDDAAETPEDAPVIIAVLANDSDRDGDGLVLVGASAPAHGTARVTNAGAVEYTPEPDYHGSDSFTYVMDDGGGLTAQATVDVTVLSVNDPPEAVDDAAETAEDTPATVDVLGNDSDPDGDELAVVEVSAPAHGVARLTPAGEVEYTPEPDYHGTDRFTYTVGDGSGLTARAAVEVTVRPVNDPPLATGVIPDQTLDVRDGPASLDLIPFFEDRDGDALGYTAVVSDQAVAVRLTGATLTLTATRPGTATVTVTAQDPGGLTATQAFMVTTTDHQARGVVEDTLAALGRGHLASARATLGRRVETTGQEQSQVTVAGLHVPLGTGAAGVAAAGQAVAERWITGLAGGMPLQPGGQTGTGAGMAPGAFGAAGGFASPAGALGIVGSGPYGAAGPAQFGAGASPTLSSLSLLGGGGQTDFLLAFGSGQAGGGAQSRQRWTVWGQVDQQAFGGARSPAARYDGNLQTAYVGVDARLSERWLAGVAVARSRGDGDWNFGSSTGRLTTNLTSVQPYLRWSDGGTTIWATAGGGSGTAENERLRYGLQEESDLGLQLGLVEARRRLATVGGGVELQLRGDASWARLTTAAGDELIDSLEVDVQQLRIGIDVSRPMRTAGGTLVEPFGEVHARHDGGVGLTGVGLEVAGGLRVARGVFRVEGMGRLLALHAADDYREHGGAVTLSVGDGARQPGLTLSLSPRWGAPATASDALWQDQLFHRAPGTPGARHDERALDARVGYGLPIRSGGLLTPFGIYGQSQYGRRVQVGLLLSRLGPLGLEVSGERYALRHPGRDEYRMSVLGSITFGGAAGRIVNLGARSRRACGGSSCAGETVRGHGRRAPLVVAPTRLDRGPLMDEAIVPPETAPSWQVVAPEALFRTGPLAVIPFVNASGAASDDWIGAGMAETISVSFEQEGVSVVRRAKLSDDAGALVTEASETEPATERAAVPARPQPGAVWLVTGEYRRLGHRLEVAAWLVDTTTGEVSASVARVGAAAAIFALQDDIAKQLRSALGRVRVGASKLDVRDDRNRR